VKEKKAQTDFCHGNQTECPTDGEYLLRNKVWNKIEQRHGKRMNSDDFILHL
jgi:hypothetical protein